MEGFLAHIQAARRRTPSSDLAGKYLRDQVLLLSFQVNLPFYLAYFIIHPGRERFIPPRVGELLLPGLRLHDSGWMAAPVWRRLFSQRRSCPLFSSLHFFWCWAIIYAARRLDCGRWSWSFAALAFFAFPALPLWVEGFTLGSSSLLLS